MSKLTIEFWKDDNCIASVTGFPSDELHVLRENLDLGKKWLSVLVNKKVVVVNLNNITHICIFEEGKKK